MWSGTSPDHDRPGRPTSDALRALSDYTSLGVDKIAHQATRDASLIRCPRDSVVMRVLGSRAERLSREGMVSREFTRLPGDAAWRLVEVDVECPACRRRACGVRLPHAVAGSVP